MGVEREHYDALSTYESYSLAWLAPIFYPLALACAAQILIVVDICRRRSGKPFLPLPRFVRAHFAEPGSIRIDPRLDAVVVTILAAEVVFAWACIVQCITNYHSKRFVGTENACDVQAWYATYYVFSAIGLAAYGILLGYHLIRTGDASLPCQSSLSPKSILPHLLPGVLIHAMAALFASLPLFGLKGYMFATDYCMFNIEAPLFSSLILSYFGLAVAAVAFAAVSATRSVGGSAAGGSAAGGSAAGGSASGGRSPTRTSLRLLVVTSVYLSIAWLTTCVIAAMWMANGKVYGSAEWRIYGAQAIILHSNQLFTPLLFGYLWRYCMQAVLDEQGLTQGATKV